MRGQKEVCIYDTSYFTVLDCFVPPRGFGEDSRAIALGGPSKSETVVQPLFLGHDMVHALLAIHHERNRYRLKSKSCDGRFEITNQRQVSGLHPGPNTRETGPAGFSCLPAIYFRQEHDNVAALLKPIG